MGETGSRAGALLVLLLSTAAVVAGGRPCTQRLGSNPPALPDLAPLFAADDISKGNTLGPLQHHEDCKALCNDEESEGELNTECWGTHLLVCRGNSSIMAAKCEGHFIGFHVPEKHAYVAVCEGLSHKFGHWHHTCSRTGRTKRHFFGKGCLGEGSAIIKVMHENDTSDESDAPTTVAALLAPTFTIQPDPAMDALATELRKSSAVGDDEDDHEEYQGASYESRCKGRGGSVFGVKWGGRDDDDDVPTSSGLAAVFHSLQAAVAEQFGAIPEDLQLGSSIPKPVLDAAEHLSNLDLLQEQPQAQTAGGSKSQRDAAERVTSTPLLAMVQMAEASQPRNAPDHPSCSLTCNDRATWLKGKWPCWGELEVSCSADAPGGRAMDFSASCKGLWTGVFGRMCLGLTLQHSTKTWPSGSAHMDGICSGKQGIWTHKQGGEAQGVFAMGQWCRGGGIDHGAFEKHEDEGLTNLVAA